MTQVAAIAKQNENVLRFRKPVPAAQCPWM